MISPKRAPITRMRDYYVILIESGLIMSMLSFIILFKMEFKKATKSLPYKVVHHEPVIMETAQITRQIKKPPPPPPVFVPIEVPKDEIIVEKELNFYTELELDDPLPLPPPPKSKVTESFFIVVEEMPELIGGIKRLQRTIHYPRTAQKAGIQGLVVVQFIVDEEGNVIKPRIIRGIGGGCDKEAVRAITTAKFKPGRQRGEPVKVKFSFPVYFRLLE